jgi:hypothetical protein
MKPLNGSFPNQHFFRERRKINACSKSRPIDWPSRQGSRKPHHTHRKEGGPFQPGNRWKSGEGEARESTEWVNIEAWARLGEVCQQYLHKGSLVFLEGRLKTDKFDDKSGETKYFTKVVALSMQMLDRKPEEEPVSTLEDESGEYEA